jgi:hypothetical protein
MSNPLLDLCKKYETAGYKPVKSLDALLNMADKGTSFRSFNLWYEALRAAANNLPWDHPVNDILTQARDGGLPWYVKQIDAARKSSEI